MHPYRPVSKRSPFGLQKGSFWTAKGVLLQRKRSPFGMQKDSFLRWHAALLMYRLKIYRSSVQWNICQPVLFSII